MRIREGAACVDKHFEEGQPRLKANISHVKETARRDI